MPQPKILFNDERYWWIEKAEFLAPPVTRRAIELAKEGRPGFEEASNHPIIRDNQFRDDSIPNQNIYLNHKAFIVLNRKRVTDATLCQGINNRSRMQCEWPRVVGERFCGYCLGRANKAGVTHGTKAGGMPGFYTRTLGPTLRARLEELATMSDEERYSLSQESDIAMEALRNALAIYEHVVVDGGADLPGQGHNIGARKTATDFLTVHMENVREMKKAALQLETTKKSVIPAVNIAWFVEAVIHISGDILLPDHEAEYRELMKRLKNLQIRPADPEMILEKPQWGTQLTLT